MKQKHSWCTIHLIVIVINVDHTEISDTSLQHTKIALMGSCYCNMERVKGKEPYRSVLMVCGVSSVVEHGVTVILGIVVVLMLFADRLDSQP